MLGGKVVEAEDAFFAVEIGDVGIERIGVLPPTNFLRQIILYFRDHAAYSFTSQPRFGCARLPTHSTHDRKKRAAISKR